MSSKFKKKVHKSSRVVERSVSYSAEIEGYDVTFYEDDHSNARLSIYPVNSQIFPRVGIIECRPERVDDLDVLAEKLPSLLRAIAEHLRRLGKDDLRSRFQREHDEMLSEIKNRAAVKEKKRA